MRLKTTTCRTSFSYLKTARLAWALRNSSLLLAALCCCLGGCNDPATTDKPSEESTSTKQLATPSPSPAENPPKQLAPSSDSSGGMSMAKMDFPAPEDMVFQDEIETNAEVPENITDLTFVKKDGGTIGLSDYAGKKHVILVFTEGFDGMLCPFCKTQTSRLVANYEEFQNRNCEVIVVYPGPDERIDEFVEAALKTEKKQVDRVPFPIVLDKDFRATNYFGIQSSHAHPSTYLIDKQGGVQFAYVGKDMTADRPSVKALLAKLDAIEE